MNDNSVSKDNKSNAQNNSNDSNDSQNDTSEFVDEEFLLTVEENEASQKIRLEKFNEEMNNLINSEDKEVNVGDFSENYWTKEYPQILTDYLAILDKYKNSSFEDEQLANIALEYIDSITVWKEWYAKDTNGDYDTDKRAYAAYDKKIELCGELQSNYGIDTGYSDKYYQVMSTLNSDKEDLVFSEMTENGEDLLTTVLKNNTDVTFEDFTINVDIYAPSGEQCASARCVTGDLMEVGVEFNPADECNFKDYLIFDSDEYDFEDCEFLVSGFNWVEPDDYLEK